MLLCLPNLFLLGDGPFRAGLSSLHAITQSCVQRRTLPVAAYLGGPLGFREMLQEDDIVS